MKKFIIIFCTVCISVSAIAQQGVRIGNYEFIVKKADSDTIVINEPCPPCPPANTTRPKPKLVPNQRTNFFVGAGAVYSDYGSDYYTVLGGTSFNIDAGWIHRRMITRWLALGGTLHYSYYNYKLKDAASEAFFNDVVLENKTFANEDIRKQLYRSHNIATGVFTRFYLVPYQVNNNGRIISGSGGAFIDLGVQGDFAPYKFCMLNTQSEGKKRYHEDYAFNSFTASAFARIGLSSDWALFARYRITDAFNSKVLPMDLPPVTIGIQLSNFR